MAFIPLTSGEIASGEPVANGTQTKIKDNFDALNSRLTSVEGGSAVVYPPIIFRMNGVYDWVAGTRILKTTINFNLSVTGVRLLVDRAGSSGTTEVNFLFKRGAGAYTSILSALPSISYTVGNDAISTNAVLDPTYVDLQTGDILALDLTSAQFGAKNLIVRIDFNKT